MARKLVLNAKAAKKTVVQTRTVPGSKGKNKVEVEVVAAVAAKTEAKRHEIQESYTGPSPTVRGHQRKLSAVRLDLGVKAITVRDEAFLRNLKAAYGLKAFHRYDLDAGCTRRAVSHGFLTHVSGDLGSREAVFKLTDKGMAYNVK